MNSKSYIQITALLFLAIALVHAWRIWSGVAVVVGDWAAPNWVSWAGVIVGGYLAYTGYKLNKR